MLIVNAALKAKAWTFEAKATGAKAKAIGPEAKAKAKTIKIGLEDYITAAITQLRGHFTKI